ncbi:MAG: hypothetical protein JM58_03170 [Peptococcaceae bacterium BICA1-8]|nr:MAG: hypothetical protein JM58_03170 [Peptococcaceae bacterium BICA1-8]
MHFLKSFSDISSIFLNMIGILSMILAVVFFFSKRFQKKILNSLSGIREIFKNLKERELDDFQFTSLELAKLVNIENGLGKKRGIYTSYELPGTIEAYANNNILALKYHHITDNSDNWVSYVITGIDDLEEYYDKGYYLSFKCKSTDIKTFVLEAKFGNLENKINIPVAPTETIFFCKLKDLFNSSNGFREICFVIRPFSENKLEGSIELSNLKFVKKIKCESKTLCLRL